MIMTGFDVVNFVVAIVVVVVVVVVDVGLVTLMVVVDGFFVELHEELLLVVEVEPEKKIKIHARCILCENQTLKLN